jgi:probable rRNA maturation factor
LRSWRTTYYLRACRARHVGGRVARSVVDDDHRQPEVGEPTGDAADCRGGVEGGHDCAGVHDGCVYTDPSPQARESVDSNEDDMPVRLVVEGGPWRGLPRALVERRARAMLVALGLPDAEWSIVLTGDARVRELNRVYRKKDKPTDVLAFPQDDATLLGDVVVSVPTAARQAAAAGHALAAEVTMLLAHGLLHLRGWDHDTVEKDRRMRKETRRLCDAALSAAPVRGRGRARTTSLRGRGRASKKKRTAAERAFRLRSAKTRC